MKNPGSQFKLATLKDEMGSEKTNKVSEGPNAWKEVVRKVTRADLLLLLLNPWQKAVVPYSKTQKEGEKKKQKEQQPQQ